ncbi:MAG: hypothetical protein C4331_09080 [Meiothermus sp.]
MPTIPEAFAKNIPVIFDGGADWIKRLLGLLETYAERWDLGLGEPFGLSFNYVVEAWLEDGSEAVLKLGIPCPDFRYELWALGSYAGRGAVRLLESDLEGGAMLLERVRPGNRLTRLEPGDEASHLAAEIMRKLHQTPVQHDFPHVSDWGRELLEAHQRKDPRLSKIPSALLDEALAAYPDLLASSPAPVLLHGDLHHFNILRGQNGWVAIDPKGGLGDPAYEPAQFLHNPSFADKSAGIECWPDLVLRTARRLEIFSEALSIPKERIRAWGIFQAALSSWWALENNYFDPSWLKAGLAIQSC